MNQILDHRDLIVWQKARMLVKSIYMITGKFPNAEKFGLCSQMQRAAISIVANIAEGKARSTRNDYAQFISIANGSAAELEALVDVALDLDYISEIAHKRFISELGEIRRMLQAMRKKLKIAA